MSAHTTIRVLHVVFSLEPGGMENGIVNVANALPEEEFEIHVACLERRGAFVDRLKHPERVTVLGKPPGFSFAASKSLRREIARIRPHLVHSHNLGPLIYSAISTSGGFQVPILQGEHAELTKTELTPKRLWQRRLFYRCCKAVHSVSHGMHAQLKDLGFGSPKLRVIVNGVDTNRFAPSEKVAAKRAAGIPENALVFGIVGRFGPFKRHRLLVEAFENAADLNPNLYLLVVGGGGPEESNVRDQVNASRHASRITLTGFQQDPRPFYHAMDLLVVPSVNEGLSNAVLEALACGIPVLAHQACGNAEVVRHRKDGFLANLSTAESLTQELINVCNHSDILPALGVSARERAISQFSLNGMVNEYRNLYKEITAIS